MSKEEETQKDKTLLPITDITEEIRDGPLSTLTNPRRNQLQDIAANGASISTDYSTLDQDFQ
jgi:hypothetical protein